MPGLKFLLFCQPNNFERKMQEKLIVNRKTCIILKNVALCRVSWMGASRLKNEQIAQNKNRSRGNIMKYEKRAPLGKKM